MTQGMQLQLQIQKEIQIQYKGNIIMTQGVQLTWEEVCTGSGWKWTGPWNTSSIFILFKFLYQLFVKAYFMNFFHPMVEIFENFHCFLSIKRELSHYQKIERSHSGSCKILNWIWSELCQSSFVIRQ